MAVANITFKLVDSEDQYKTMLVHYNESEVDTLEKAQHIATILAPKIAGISGCKVVGARVDFPLTVPADAAPDAGSRVDAGATLSFYNTSGTAHSLYIPGFLTSKMVSGVVTASDSNVAGFIATLTTGDGITGSYISVDRHELPLQAYRKGFQSVRKTGT